MASLFVNRMCIARQRIQEARLRSHFRGLRKTAVWLCCPFLVPLLLLLLELPLKLLALSLRIGYSEASNNLEVAASHVKRALATSSIGFGSVRKHSSIIRLKSSCEAYVLQFSNVAKNALLGCSAQITNLPIAKASAVVVATTSESDGLMKILKSSMDLSR